MLVAKKYVLLISLFFVIQVILQEVHFLGLYPMKVMIIGKSRILNGSIAYMYISKNKKYMNKDVSETKVMLMKLFIRFLKERGVFKKFTTNFYEYWEKKGNPKKLCEYLEDKPSSYFLTGAFHWEDSNEGHNFWRYLSDDWFAIKNRILHKMKLVDE